MARVPLKTYEGKTVNINPEDVISVSSYQHFDHPEAGYAGKQTAEWAKKHDLTEFHPEQDIPVDYSDPDRISTRVVLTTSGGSIVVVGTEDEVNKALFPK